MELMNFPLNHQDDTAGVSCSIPGSLRTRTQALTAARVSPEHLSMNLQDSSLETRLETGLFLGGVKAKTSWWAFALRFFSLLESFKNILDCLL